MRRSGPISRGPHGTKRFVLTDCDVEDVVAFAYRQGYISPTFDEAFTELLADMENFIGPEKVRSIVDAQHHPHLHKGSARRDVDSPRSRGPR